MQKDVPLPAEAYRVLFDRSLRLLDPVKGLMLLQIPWSISTFEDDKAWKDMKRYFHEINKLTNVSVIVKSDDTHWRVGEIPTWISGWVQVKTGVHKVFWGFSK